MARTRTQPTAIGNDQQQQHAAPAGGCVRAGRHAVIVPDPVGAQQRRGDRPEDREGAGVTREVVAADDVGEAQPAIQPPGPVGLAVDLRGGQQHVRLGAAREQPAGQRLAQAAALGARMDVQFGQLEVARHQLGDAGPVGADPLQARRRPAAATTGRGRRSSRRRHRASARRASVGAVAASRRPGDRALPPRRRPSSRACGCARATSTPAGPRCRADSASRRRRRRARRRAGAACRSATDR